MLHNVDLSNWKTTAWCVPTALSVVTGVPIVHAHSRAAMFQNEKLKDVSGVELENMIMMFREQGYRLIPIDLPKRYPNNTYGPKLSRFFKDMIGYEKVMPVVVHVTGTKDSTHVLATHMGWAMDNWTKKPVRCEEFPRLDRNVIHAFIVEKVI